MDTLPVSPVARRTGLVLTGLAVAFLLFDAVGKLVGPAAVLDTFAPLGWDPALAPVLGGLLLACLIVYLAPRTAVLGAILLTGYLGAAVATQLRVGNPLASHVLFSVYVGVIVWAGLLLRHPEARRVVVPFLR